MVHALNKNPHTLRIHLRHRNEEVMPQLHILDIRLVQLERVPPEHHAQDQVQFRPSEVDAETAPGAAAETHQVPLEGQPVGGGGVVEPALGDELVAVGEDGLVVRDLGDGHADVGVGRDGPVLVLQGLGAAGARVARAEAVGEAHGLHDAGFQVGHLLQRVELEGGAVGEGGDEVGVQAVVDAGRVDDVEGGDAEGEGGGFYAAADYDLGFFFQALLGFVFWG